MPTRVAVISPGGMGAGIGMRLRERGAEVLTHLGGRGPASAERARNAGMQPVGPDGIAQADFVLSVVPPGSALQLAALLAPALSAASAKPVYVDCNAVSPETVERIGETVAAAGCPFVDGGIIGGPPTSDGKSPVLYVSGAAAVDVVGLTRFGLDVRALPGPIGAASALKMSYAGITKGFTAIGAAMALAATRAGLADALRSELADSQPELLAWLSRQVPRMYPKAYRWVAEMEEIGAFIADGDAGSRMLDGAARLYDRIAADASAERSETEALSRFFDRRGAD